MGSEGNWRMKFIFEFVKVIKIIRYCVDARNYNKL